MISKARGTGDRHPPLALIFAKFALRGQQAVRWIPKKLQYFLKPQVKRGNKRFTCGFFVRGAVRLTSDFHHQISRECDSRYRKYDSRIHLFCFPFKVKGRITI